MCRGALAEERGDTESVIESIDAILRFSASLETEPDLVSVLVRRRIEFHATELLRWLLNHRQLSGQELTRLERSFRSIDSTNRLGRALVAECCTTVATFGYSSDQLLNVMDLMGLGYKNRTLTALLLDCLRLSGTFKKDEIRYLAWLEDYRNVLRLPMPAAIDRAEQISSSIKAEDQKKFIITGTFLPPVLKGIEREAASIARQSSVQTALAVERYKLKNGQFPDFLHELQPVLISPLLVDPFSGGELHYRRNQNSYTIYSVGPDRRDDGGSKEVPEDFKQQRPSGDITFSVVR
jgi:hypothetical protein